MSARECPGLRVTGGDGEKKMFKKYNIPFHVENLDSAEYQVDNKGGRIRAALQEKTGCKTIPQIFVGKEFIGGSTEMFDEFKAGRLQKRLNDSGITIKEIPNLDPYSFLPAWLQPR